MWRCQVPVKQLCVLGHFPAARYVFTFLLHGVNYTVSGSYSLPSLFKSATLILHQYTTSSAQPCPLLKCPLHSHGSIRDRMIQSLQRLITHTPFLWLKLCLGQSETIFHTDLLPSPRRRALGTKFAKVLAGHAHPTFMSCIHSLYRSADTQRKRHVFSIRIRRNVPLCQILEAHIGWHGGSKLADVTELLTLAANNLHFYWSPASFISSTCQNF